MNLKKVIQETAKKEWEVMRDSCIVRANDFSLDSFKKKLKSLIQL
jgi:hypothetical protein